MVRRLSAQLDPDLADRVDPDDLDVVDPADLDRVAAGLRARPTGRPVEVDDEDDDAPWNSWRD